MNAFQMAAKMWETYTDQLAKGETTREETMSALVAAGKVASTISGKDTENLTKAMRMVWKRLSQTIHPDELEMMLMEAQNDRVRTLVEETRKFEVRRAMESLPHPISGETSGMAPLVDHGSAPDADNEGQRIHPAHVIPNGYYTVSIDGDHRTFRVTDHWEEAEAANGSQVIRLLVGSDNTSDYVGIGFLKGNRVSYWKKFRGDTLAERAVLYLLGNPGSAGEAYAMRTGRCYRCGRKLTVPTSLHRGLGPICAEKIGALV